MTKDSKELLQSMKKAVVLLTLESCGIPPRLHEGISDGRNLSPKGQKAIRAATELGIAERAADGRIHWSADYRAIASQRAGWGQFIAILKHHVTYLTLVQAQATLLLPGTAAQAQVRADPDAYRAYLEGVAESHRDRARVFARLAPLRDARSLVDLGGGLGAYSTAWVESQRLRTATLVDLPEVIEMLAASPPLPGSQLRLHAADLTKAAAIPKGDVYLLANVLHLFRGWRSVLGNVVSLMPANSRLSVLEATSEGASGAFFDLQVCLRSVRGGGLIKPIRLEEFLLRSGLCELTRRELGIVEDPLNREYWLWLGTKRD